MTGSGSTSITARPYGLMNSPNLMAASAAQRTKHLQAADLRQPAAAARAAAPRRGTGDDRLPVERAADLRLCPRHPARIPGAQRARSPSRGRGSRKPTTSSPAPGPRRCSTTRASSGPTRMSRCGRARCSARIRRSGCRWSAARSRSSSPAGTICRSPRASAALAACATTSSAFTRSVLAGRGHRITPDHLSLGITAYVADSKAQALKEYGPHILYFNRTLFSHGNFTETEHAARRPAIRRRLRPITCGRKTCALPPICAPSSAT